MKRFYMSLIALAAIAALTTAGSFALFRATTTNATNTFTSGTVSLGEPASTMVAIDPMAPGDSGSVGTYTVAYTGNLSAWIGVDAVLSGALTASDCKEFFTVTVGGTTLGGANDLFFNNQLASVTPVVPGPTASVSIPVSYAFSIDATNDPTGVDCSNKSAQLSLVVHAVQSAHNPEAPATTINW